jgi:hypothetical protein
MLTYADVCEVDLSFVNDLKLLSQRDEGAALGGGATSVVQEVQEEGEGGPGVHAYLLLPEALSEDDDAGENSSGDQRGGTQGGGDSGVFGGRRSTSGGWKSVAPGGTELWTSGILLPSSLASLFCSSAFPSPPPPPPSPPPPPFSFSSSSPRPALVPAQRVSMQPFFPV